MKAKLAFLAIALIAVTSAFTTAKVLAHRYKVASIDSSNNRYQLVDATDIINETVGTSAGQYECNNSSNSCTIETDLSATQSGGVWYVSFSDSEQYTQGTFVQH